MMIPSLLFCLVGVLASGSLAFSAAIMVARRIEQKKRRLSFFESWSTQPNGESDTQTSSQDDRTLQYLKRLTRELISGTAQPLSPSVRSKRISRTPMSKWFVRRASWAGCVQVVSPAAFIEASLRLGMLGGALGCVVGMVLSTELGLILALCGFTFGYLLPYSAVRKAIKQRAEFVELHLSEMLQIVSLGLRSGLTFDRSFALYAQYFHNEFSQSCGQAYRRWTLGLSTRETSLKEFAASYKCDQLAHVVDSVLRSIQFGSSLAPILEEASIQARASYKANMEERVAKAPVKMMLPTGTLILPAMLLFVLGPVLLELIQGF